MNRKLKYFIPFVFVSIFFFSNYFFSCKHEGAVPGLFGDMQQSPIKSASNGADAVNLQDSFKKIYDLYKDRVVFITTEQLVRVQQHPFFDDPFMRDFFGKKNRDMVQKRTGLGTGFIVSEDGYICTNHHVISGVDSVKVTINEKIYQAKIIGFDERTDVALLKIEPKGKLEPVYFGDSDKVNVGNWAIAIGNPFGLDKTFTVGVVSAIGRRDVDMMGGSHIQTDASINPGNSGGTLINIDGEVIGVNRMIYSKSGGYMGIGFAIPINTARSILSQLKQHKKVQRGYIGVSVIPLTEGYAKELGLSSARGVIVGEAISGGPAEQGGIRVGDVILKIDGQAVDDYKIMLSVIGEAPVGKSLKITVWRDGQQINLFVKSAERP